ncbi:MAG: UvrD-helicase domain-containing protein [Polyangiaceae bacterium]
MRIRIPRPAVLREIPLDRHTVIEASAGTGKTFTLEHLVVELLLRTDVAFEQLLIVTFTEKATQEIRSRVRAKLEDMVSGRGEEVSAETSCGPDDWVIDDVLRGRLARAVRAFDSGTITTIHAFCQRILRDNAFASGRLFDEQPVDGREAFGRALRDALRREAATDPGRALWLQAALEFGWSIAQIETLLWDCKQARGSLRPEFDLAGLTAALHAMPVDDARLTDLTAALKGCGVHPSRANNACQRIRDLADLVDRTRLTGDVARYVREAERLKVAQLIEQVGSVSLSAGPAARICAAALALARRTPPFAAAVAGALLPAVERALVQAKRDAGRYDFDDMLMLVDEALSGPGGRALVSAIRGRWRYALIDEFQDTDETQWSIFRRGFFERSGREGPAGNLFLVGDPKQSIYRFRGADLDTYFRARDEVIAGGGKLVSLEINYRATSALVEATNDLFDATASEPMLSGKSRYRPVSCGRPGRSLVDGQDRPVSPLHILRFHDELSGPALGAAIAREIRQATDPLRPWKFDGTSVTYRDIFVLTRTAREGRVIGAALREAGVPRAFYKDEGLFQSDAAKDLRTLLAAIDDPDDRARRLAVWLTPFFGLPLSALERTRDLPAGHPLFARLRTWKSLADARSFDRLFESVVTESGILRREIFAADGERELTNTMHVIDLLLERAREGHVTLRDLASELGGLIAKTRSVARIEGNLQRLDSERRAVQIMTIHKAKGLEAPLVFVAGGFSASGSDDVHVYHEHGRRLAWVGSPSPEVKPIVKLEEREEEERLMYVALTRAEGRLILPCVVDGASSKNLRGPYARVNHRIVALLAGADGWTVEDVTRAPPISTLPLGRVAGDTPDRWRPSGAMWRQQGPAESFDSLRARHAGAILTSYTRMKGGRAARAAWIASADDADAEPVEAASETSGASLRAARTSGVFLHELLERVPVASFCGAPDVEAWRARADVRELFDEAMTVHRIDPEQRRHAESLVWTAYCRPVVLPTGASIESFAAAARVVREMKFVYPVASADGPERASAYVRGSLDLVFDHGSLTYFVDWKSDSLRSYAPDALNRQVEEHYRDQVKLYTLAVTKLLGVTSRSEHEARFGGLLYCFLRGFDSDGCGLWSLRPSWDDVRTWVEELRGAAFS